MLDKWAGQLDTQTLWLMCTAATAHVPSSSTALRCADHQCKHNWVPDTCCIRWLLTENMVRKHDALVTDAAHSCSSSTASSVGTYRFRDWCALEPQHICPFLGQHPYLRNINACTAECHLLYEIAVEWSCMCQPQLEEEEEEEDYKLWPIARISYSKELNRKPYFETNKAF